MLPVSYPIIEQAISLRQQRKMSLGDALIAATALAHDLELATANTNDFDWIEDLDVINPVIL
uniref:PIN domain-containing protein n=1 Tax=Candidatus Kentrum sp. TUN TaxID=2126343 RepID=A0A450ZPR3_9GAMM|nr:MAG: PIN domain-containing protein [Candidatus Kentron sp. TUN]VFK55822.1 MAG: PIN domain-containing protein [Candidatus Kentron sp. TUN]